MRKHGMLKLRKFGGERLGAIYRRMPERLLGRKEDWRLRFYAQYGTSWSPEQIEELVNAERKKLMYRYFAAALAGILCFTGTVISREAPDLQSLLVRPEYQEAARRVPLEASVRCGEEELVEDITLTVGPRRPGKKELKQWMASLADSLPDRILGENKSLRRVSRRLNLFTKDEETGIVLRWFSERPERIREDGFVDTIGVEKPEPVLLKAELTLSDLKQEVMIQTVVTAAEETGALDEALRNRVKQAVSAAEEAKEGAAVILPNTLGDKVSAEWKPRDSWRAPPFSK